MLWITTPGHGYLKVSKEDFEFKTTGFKPSVYSYQDKDCFYLEEDCDATSFLKKMYPEEWLNVIKDLPEVYDEKESFKHFCI